MTIYSHRFSSDCEFLPLTAKRPVSTTCANDARIQPRQKKAYRHKNGRSRFRSRCEYAIRASWELIEILFVSMLTDPLSASALPQEISAPAFSVMLEG